ncbi:MAG: hypothetical protein DMG21_04760 [Acidobacteria bacterium]|nr:MAG: hypothetical protein DMG21_04760 [Acidobacteriota bacterium]
MTDVAKIFGQNELLITGANGFLGKVLLGLVLDRYPGVARLHVLIRPRRGLSAAERFSSEVLKSPALVPVVEKIEAQYGKDFLRDKITVWGGDVGEPNLGLDRSAAEKLSARLGAVINCAGLVDFFPAVDEAFRSNVDGVEHVVAFAKASAAKLVHISTCYVCGARDGLVEETEPILGFYPRRKGLEDNTFKHAEEIQYVRAQIRQILDSSAPPELGNGGGSPTAGLPALGQQTGSERSRELIDRLRLLGRHRAASWGWVNTYTYTKSLGEQVIASTENLDYAIVRPAIVESALGFPFPGWIEGGRTAAPLVLMALDGMKDWPVREDSPLEVVPVDMVAAAILIVTASLLDGRAERVYQLGSADVNPIHLGPLVNFLSKHSSNGQDGNHSQPAVPYLLRKAVGAEARSAVRFVTAEELGARRESLQKRLARAEGVLAATRRMLERARLPGKNQLAGWSAALRTLGLQASFREQTLDQYLPFVLHNRYIFESENVRAAFAALSEEDRKHLPWEPERIGWKDYWANQQVPGIQKWIQPEGVRNRTFRV